MFPGPRPNSGPLLAALGLLFVSSSAAVPDILEIPEIAAFFGTKTRYEDANAQLSVNAQLLVNASVLSAPPGERCAPVHVTAVIRHGSRLPTSGNVRRIRRLSALLRGESGESARDPEAPAWGPEAPARDPEAPARDPEAPVRTDSPREPQASAGWLQDILRWECWFTDDMDGEFRYKPGRVCHKNWKILPQKLEYSAKITGIFR